MEYKECFEIMGTDRNSYSKTDLEATFMRMKEDHMRNGQYYNMKYEVFEDEHYYVCHDGRQLRHIRTETKEQSGYQQTFEVYGCADCSGCQHKSKCLYKYNAEKDTEKNKVMKINEQWEELKEESHANIQSEKGIVNIIVSYTMSSINLKEK